MSSLESAIALIEAERIDLYGKLKALDDALAQLQKISHDLAVQDHRPPREIPRADTSKPRGRPRATPAPERIVPRGKPRGEHRTRRKFTDDEKRAGAELGHRIGAAAAAGECDVVVSVMRRWMELHPAGEPTAAPPGQIISEKLGENYQRVVAEQEANSETPAAQPDPDAALELPATLRLMNKLGRQRCSCGTPIDSPDDWKRHNARLDIDELKDHRLEVIAADA